ncbi:MAG: thioredoxin family protein [Bacteroidetes bacterium]|nr:thioredoxin family protein [Bacteroidota bacterium]
MIIRTNLNEVRDFVKSRTAVLLYFFNDDCPPCISLRPKVEQLVGESFHRLDLLWINSKKHPEIPVDFGVFANPTLILFFEGREFKRYGKYVSVTELERDISRYYQLLFE